MDYLHNCDWPTVSEAWCEVCQQPLPVSPFPHLAVSALRVYYVPVYMLLKDPLLLLPTIYMARWHIWWNRKTQSRLFRDGFVSVTWLVVNMLSSNLSTVYFYFLSKDMFVWQLVVYIVFLPALPYFKKLFFCCMLIRLVFPLLERIGYFSSVCLLEAHTLWPMLTTV